MTPALTGTCVPKTILTVDDSPSMRMLLRVALGDLGFAVTAAEDGIQALDRLDEALPDLLITDINMPRLDGFGLIERVRAQPRCRHLPILVLTTESTPEKRQRARAAGATGWIVKPFHPESLAAAIRRVLH